MENRISLVIPTIEHKGEALEFRQAFFDFGENTIDGSELLDRIDAYEDWLAMVADNANADTLRENGILTDTYFAVDGSQHIVGVIDFRHELNDFFKDFGHCGYSVLPSERRKGYATEMLGLIVERAAACGLKEIQLSVLRSNIPSIKTILNNGGRFERSFEFAGEIADVYIITL